MGPRIGRGAKKRRPGSEAPKCPNRTGRRGKKKVPSIQNRESIEEEPTNVQQNINDDTSGMNQSTRTTNDVTNHPVGSPLSETLPTDNTRHVMVSGGSAPVGIMVSGGSAPVGSITENETNNTTNNEEKNEVDERVERASTETTDTKSKETEKVPRTPTNNQNEGTTDLFLSTRQSLGNNQNVSRSDGLANPTDLFMSPRETPGKSPDKSPSRWA